MNPWEYAEGCSAVHQRVDGLRYSGNAKRTDFTRENNDVTFQMGRCLQGVVNLVDNTDEDGDCGGGTILVPGFHKVFDQWIAGGHFDERQRCVGSMQYKVADRSPLNKFAVRVT